MTQFGKDPFLHRRPHGVFGARGGEEDAAFDDAGGGPAHDGRRADFLIRQKAEHLAESVQPLLQYAIHRFARGVPSRNAGTAFDDDRLHLLVGRGGFDLSWVGESLGKSWERSLGRSLESGKGVGSTAVPNGRNIRSGLVSCM